MRISDGKRRENRESDRGREEGEKERERERERSVAELASERAMASERFYLWASGLEAAVSHASEIEIHVWWQG